MDAACNLLAHNHTTYERNGNARRDAAKALPAMSMAPVPFENDCAASHVAGGSINVSQDRFGRGQGAA